MAGHSLEKLRELGGHCGGAGCGRWFLLELAVLDAAGRVRTVCISVDGYHHFRRREDVPVAHV